MWITFIIYLGSTLLSIKPLIGFLATCLWFYIILVHFVFDFTIREHGENLGKYQLNNNNCLDKAQKLIGMKLTIFVTLLAIMIPSKDTIKYMVGGYIVWNGAAAVQKIEGINKLPEKFVKVANTYLDSVVEEFSSDFQKNEQNVK